MSYFLARGEHDMFLSLCKVTPSCDNISNKVLEEATDLFVSEIISNLVERMSQSFGIRLPDDSAS